MAGADPADTPAGRRRFEQVMEERRLKADPQDYRSIRRGWCVGSAEFREELLAQVRGQVGPNHFDPGRREADEQHARRVIADFLKEAGMDRARLELLPGSSTAKLGLARRLRRETTMSLNAFCLR
jgi:hypothetical protein